MEDGKKLTAVRLNIKILDDLGLIFVRASNCPECELTSFVQAENPMHVCGYCGYGPWER